MTARCIISPIINPTPNSQMPKAELYCTALGNYYSIGVNGRFVLPWCVTLGFTQDWTAADADAEIESLFTVPGNVNTRTDLRAWLQGVTVADMTVGQRSRFAEILDNHLIDRSDFTLATTGFQVMRRILNTLAVSDANHAVLDL